MLLFAGSALIFKSNNNKLKIAGNALYIIGFCLLGIYIAILWITLERPPLRTLGETRLWYAFFMASVGYIIYLRWKLVWMLIYASGMTTVFVLINVLKPENFDKTLMPALQSHWFVPHVIVYIFAYALLGASAIISLKALYLDYKNKYDSELLEIADNIVYVGFSFLTFGLLFGALWAKEAWGNYWTWDPKETWAFLTWILYLLYMHYRIHKPKEYKTAIIILTLAFVFLLICWLGLNYLPIAQNSVHTYTN